MKRRYFLSSAIAIGAVAGLSRFPLASTGLREKNQKRKARKSLKFDGVNKVNKTDEEWKRTLTPAQYEVTRNKGTERPFSSPLNENHDRGVFQCVACGLPLFSSEHKFNSGTGWPSFWQPIDKENVNEEVDSSLFMERTEVLCARCDSHLGHVFNDGPKPTGLRYCMNGVALNFVKDKD